MNVKPIHTNTDYESALKRIEMLMDAESGSKDLDELEILSTLVEAYENKHFPILTPDPIEAIKFRMDQMGMSNSDLEKVICSKRTSHGRGRVSEILNKRRHLTLDMVRSLNKKLHIPAEVLVKSYSLKA
jgi:HTH-type transcriptional regulator/antitoxin HigA